VLAILVVVLAVFLAANARLFVWPPTNLPTKVDAIVALGGDPGQRRAKAAVHLARVGYAPVVVVSLGGYSNASCPIASPKVKVICFRPNPVNTRGEAEYVSRLAARRHWQKLIVVPERSQTTRARLLFKRCTDASLEFVPVEDRRSRLLIDVAYEWGALAKALVLHTSC
jgi:uncharacterized SAM-binding protein YcdF (DUF218 family)